MKPNGVYVMMFVLCVSSYAYSMEADEFVRSLHAYEGDTFPTPLLQAVQDGDEKKIAQLLKDGTSLMAKGTNGMTVFHKILFFTSNYDNTLKTLFVAPRKGVLETVAKMKLDDKEDKLANLARWHIKGLRRALVVCDQWGSIPFDYADFLWKTYLKPGSKELVDDFYKEIKEGYSAMLDEKAYKDLYA